MIFSKRPGSPPRVIVRLLKSIYLAPQAQGCNPQGLATVGKVVQRCCSKDRLRLQACFQQDQRRFGREMFTQQRFADLVRLHQFEAFNFAVLV